MISLLRAPLLREIGEAGGLQLGSPTRSRNHKRWQSSPRKQEDKKPKHAKDSSQGALSQAYFKCAKKQNLCFNYFSDQHTKQKCPKLQGKDVGSSTKGKENALHRVQCLTRDPSSKCTTVEVLHTKEKH